MATIMVVGAALCALSAGMLTGYILTGKVSGTVAMLMAVAAASPMLICGFMAQLRIERREKSDFYSVCIGVMGAMCIVNAFITAMKLG